MSEEKSVNKKSNFNDILQGLSELNKQNIVTVYVPSIDEEINFRPLTVKQQKQILSTGIDAELENLSFSNAMNDIIMENCLSDKQSIKIIDKPAILLQLRQKAVGDMVNIKAEDTEYKISITEQIDKVRNMKVKRKSNFTIKSDGIEITGRTPNLKIDTLYNKQFTKKIKKENKGSQLTLSDVVGDIFVHEMVKYIDTITLGDNVVRMDGSLSVDQSIKLFESLPMSLSLAVAEEIKTTRELEVATISSDLLPEDTQITIDASLFTTE